MLATDPIDKLLLRINQNLLLSWSEKITRTDQAATTEAWQEFDEYTTSTDSNTANNN